MAQRGVTSHLSYNFLCRRLLLQNKFLINQALFEWRIQTVKHPLSVLSTVSTPHRPICENPKTKSEVHVQRTDTCCFTVHTDGHVLFHSAHGTHNKQRAQAPPTQNTAYLRQIRSQSRAMAQAVSRRPLAAEARVRSRVSPRGICGGQGGTGTGFSLEYFGFPLSVSFHRCCITWKNENINHLHYTVAQ